MKSKLLVMIADNITAADVSNKSDISYLSFDGKRSMPITDKASIDKAIEHIRDFYNVDNFEEDTDVIIVYNKLSSEMIDHFAGSFVGCDKIGVIPAANMIPEIIRNKKAELPVELSFDQSLFRIGVFDNDLSTHIDVELNDLLFLYYVDSDYFDGVSKKELDELTKQLNSSNKDNSSLKKQNNQLSEQIKNLKAEISSKNDEIKKLKLSQVNLQAKIDAVEKEKRLMSERSIVRVNIPNNVWDSIEDWNSEHKRDGRVYVFLHTPNFSSVKKGECISKGLRVSFSKSVNLDKEPVATNDSSNVLGLGLCRAAPAVSAIMPMDFVKLSNLFDRNGVKHSNFGKGLDIVIECAIKAEKTGEVFRLIKETDKITEQNQAIAVIGNENDTREDIDKWLVEIGRSDLKCV